MVKAWCIAASKIRPKIKKNIDIFLFFVAPRGLVPGHGPISVKGLVAFYKLV